MPRSYASTVVNAPAATVWSHIRDFNGLPQWHSGLVAKSHIEGGKSGDQVGAIRNFELTDGTGIRELLTAHSDTERSYTYAFCEPPFPVVNYLATIRVSPVTDGDRTFVEWWTTFDCELAELAHWTDFFASQVFKGGLDAVRDHFAK